jgi:arginine decarboxylase
MIPKYIFFTKGVGRHKDKLQSFELALREAGIAQLNLVSVSSIFPPRCKILSKEKGVQHLKPGQVTFVVMARAETQEPNRLIASSIGLALPAEGENYGYLSEHHCFGMTERKAGDYAEDLAASMLGSTLGIEVDPDTAYDERKEIYRMSGKIIRTSSITQSALGDKNGLWTTVIAAAVLIPPNGMEEKIGEVKQQVKEIPQDTKSSPLVEAPQKQPVEQKLSQ